MKKGTKRLIKSIVIIIPMIALFFFIVSIWASVYTFVYSHIFLTMLISAGIVGIFVLIGVLSWKKIKRKIIDIFT